MFETIWERDTMLKKTLDRSVLYTVAASFRAAIIRAKKNCEFDRRDRMSNFPSGCCDDACDLLAYYLQKKFHIPSKQKIGVYRDDNPESITNHVWLMVNDIMIDITADQFPSLIDYTDGIYVGVESEFYRRLENIETQENYNIENNVRLSEDYKTIIKYID